MGQQQCARTRPCVQEGDVLYFKGEKGNSYFKVLHIFRLYESEGFSAHSIGMSWYIRKKKKHLTVFWHWWPCVQRTAALFTPSRSWPLWAKCCECKNVCTQRPGYVTCVLCDTLAVIQHSTWEVPGTCCKAPVCRGTNSCPVQLFPVALLDTNNISSDRYIRWLEEVKETEEIRSNIPCNILQMKVASWKHFLQ